MGLLDLLNNPAVQGLFTPSDEDKKAARSHMLLAMSTGLLGTRKGQEGAGFSRGIAGGMDAYNRHLQTANDRQLEKLKLARWMQGADREDEQFKRQQLEWQRADEQRAALEAARQGAMIPGGQAPVPMGPPDASGSTGMYQTPGGFDRARYADALDSIDPFRAQQYRATMAKDSPLGKPDMHRYTPQSLARYQQTHNPADLVPVPDKEATPFGKANPSDFTPQSFQRFVAGGGTDYSVLQPIDKRPITSLSVNTAPKAFWGDFGKGQSDVLLKAHEGATKAAESLSLINNAREAIAGGAYQGGLASPKLAFVNTMRGMGFEIDDRTLANTGALRASFKQMIMQRAKELGTNPSNIDVRLLDEALGGIDNDPGATNKVLDWMDRQARTRVRSFNNQYQQVMRQPGAFSAYDMSVPEPEQFRPTQQKLQAIPSVERAYAKRALNKGADPAEVRRRLIERGYDPSGL